MSVKRAGFVIIAILGLASGGWAQTFEIDPVHSSVGFTIRHIVSNVKGRFTDFSGAIVYDPKKIENSSVNVVIKAASLDTDNEKRDNHLRSPDFFEVEKYPEIIFKSTKVVKEGEKYILHGLFTMHGVEKSVSFPFEILGVAPGPGGVQRAGFEAETKLNRKDYGIIWNRTLDQGGLLLGEEVKINLSIEAAEKTEEKKG
jgi:polyisoprenoid-binding protein YceI